MIDHDDHHDHQDDDNRLCPLAHRRQIAGFFFFIFPQIHPPRLFVGFPDNSFQMREVLWKLNYTIPIIWNCSLSLLSEAQSTLRMPGKIWEKCKTLTILWASVSQNGLGLCGWMFCNFVFVCLLSVCLWQSSAPLSLCPFLSLWSAQMTGTNKNPAVYVCSAWGYKKGLCGTHTVLSKPPWGSSYGLS